MVPGVPAVPAWLLTSPDAANTAKQALQVGSVTAHAGRANLPFLCLSWGRTVSR